MKANDFMRLFTKKCKLLLLPKKKVISLKFSPGLRIYGINRPGYGLRGAYLYGFSYEPELLTLDLFLANGDSFIDVGCSTGIYSIKASQLVGRNGMVLSIDANPEMVNCLLKSVVHNNLSNVKVLSVGVGSKSEYLKFYCNSAKPNSFSFKQFDKEASGEKIRCEPLDEIVTNLELNNVKYIKVDVEGFESEVLIGARKLIETYRPVIQVENTFGMPKILLEGYQVWGTSKSPNSLLIPDEYFNESTFKRRIETFGFELQASNKS